jgi:prepilin-type N-terminal cleavage/methylation domain-containing protein
LIMVHFTRKSGFTLPEVVIALGVLSFGMAMLASLSIYTLRYSHEEQMQNSVERRTALFLEYFHRDIMAAAAVLPDFPGVSKKAKSLILKVPEFDEFGIHARGTFDYVVYEYFDEPGRAVRTVYDDELGGWQIESMEISAGSCGLKYLADGKSLPAIKDFTTIQTLQLAALQQEEEHGFEYTRSYVTASTMRNPDK